MKFVKCGKGFRVNGQYVTLSALRAICEEIFVAETWQGILDELYDTGEAQRDIMPGYTARNLFKENAELKAKLKQAG